MKIGKEDFEAILTGSRDIRDYMEIDPKEGVATFFGVLSASNPDYLVRAIYEMYEKNLNRPLAVKATAQLFRSVGLGSVGLNNFLKKLGMNLTPAEFLMLVFRLQHQQEYSGLWDPPRMDRRYPLSDYGEELVLS
jgi:hypothetical protein